MEAARSEGAGRRVGHAIAQQMIEVRAAHLSGIGPEHLEPYRKTRARTDAFPVGGHIKAMRDA